MRLLSPTLAARDAPSRPESVYVPGGWCGLWVVRKGTDRAWETPGPLIERQAANVGEGGLWGQGPSQRGPWLPGSCQRASSPAPATSPGTHAPTPRGEGTLLGRWTGGSNQVGLQPLEPHTGKMASDTDPRGLPDLSVGCTGQAVRSGVHLQTGMHTHTHRQVQTEGPAEAGDLHPGALTGRVENISQCFAKFFKHNTIREKPLVF